MASNVTTLTNVLTTHALPTQTAKMSPADSSVAAKLASGPFSSMSHNFR